MAFDGAVETFLIDRFSRKIKQQCKLSLVQWKPMCVEYPNFLLLKSDKSILGYVDLCYNDATEGVSDNLFERDMQSLVNTVRVAYSQLDRPVFFVYLVNGADEQMIYFETDEDVRLRLLAKPIVSKYYTPCVEEMGNFEDLSEILVRLKDMKGVRV